MDENDFISREAAIDANCWQCGYKCQEKNCDVVDRIRHIPAANVRPVVLCKDCKSYVHDIPSGETGWCKRHRWYITCDDFCSDGRYEAER